MIFNPLLLKALLNSKHFDGFQIYPLLTMSRYLSLWACAWLPMGQT